MYMENTWDFFEELDEAVYVSDADTYELIYMNRHLRESLGYGDGTDYAGKMCYQVLQGADAPCDFCTNGKIKPGEFLSWVHTNPLLTKRFLVKDTIVERDGRRYRIEIAIDTALETSCKAPYYYARTETILNECMQRMFTNADPEQSIEDMLAYIGTTFQCDRAYIFEIYDNATTSNTYEWCAEGVLPQKELLQNLGTGAIDWWLSLFANNEVTVISDLEEIRLTHPEAYAILQPQQIHSLAAGPIKLDGKIVGFLGVDNPDEHMIPLITPLLNIMGYFVSTLFKRRDLLARLHDLSYHDQLTGAFNRHALCEQYDKLQVDSLGVIYCDITGLKSVNDSQGHEAGDRMICHCCQILQDAVSGGTVYRAGGDEFIALYPDCSERKFQESLHLLQQKIRDDSCNISVGYVWSDEKPMDLEKLITEADRVMYQNKRAFYRENYALPGVERRRPEEGRRRETLQQSEKNCDAPSAVPVPAETPFQKFISETDYDLESLFQSVSQDNDSSYFYMGDMQKNLFYISDNLKEDFGFAHNRVEDFMQQWERRISTPEFQHLFRQDVSSMLLEKRTLHDLRYQVRDIHGNNLWIRCYGILKWNKEKTQPLFFSGRVTHQDKNFVVDPITNFPREHASFQQLEELRKSGERTLIIGFSLNGFTEINNTKGRAYGDRLFKRTADALSEELLWKMSFYRLEGMRCMAVVNTVSASDGPETLVEEIRAVVRRCYEAMEVSVQNVCSFGVMEYPNGDMTPEDLTETLVSLIRLAKQDSNQSYVDYSAPNIRRIKRMANMVLALGENVANGMENFRIVIQPIVSAGDGTPIGGEVLLRWSFEGEDISPATFVPILEKSNLIHTVGRWVFEQAVSTCARIHAHDSVFYLTFNVSLHQLSDPLLLPFMQKTLRKYHLKGSSLVAELTESCLDEQPEKLSHFVQECQKMEMYIALDDFGSGYSSLQMLLQYPCSIIKLDRSLVQEVTDSEAKMHFIRSIVFACHQFGKAVCMEGVETSEQNEIIQSTGCDMIQGFFYHRPMELSQIYELVAQESLKHPQYRKAGAQ